MTEFLVTVRITPRRGLLDPEGKAIHGALESLGFPAVDEVRVGRLVRLRLAAESNAAAHDEARRMCEKLLANPVTEDYRIEVESPDSRRPRKRAAGAHVHDDPDPDPD
ncbi:MAG: phosphoribosylformylglycinamidine synthase subunit PurS [Longimicrobiales bacterium]